MAKLLVILLFTILAWICVLDAQIVSETEELDQDVNLAVQEVTTVTIPSQTQTQHVSVTDAKPKKPPRKGKKKLKKTRPPTVCPDTCTIKRRLGKVESNFASTMDEAKYAFTNDIADLKRYIKGLTIPTEDMDDQDDMSRTSEANIVELLYQIRSNLSQRVDRDFHKFKAELRTETIENQRTIQDANEQLKELMRTVPAMVSEATSQQQTFSNNAVARAMNSMNRTFVVMQSQNYHLTQKTQALRQQNNAIRAQNSVLEQQNIALKSQMDNLEYRSSNSKNRLRELEDSTSYQNSSIYRIDNKLRWVDKRVDVLERSMEEVKALAEEAKNLASEASLDAQRAVNDIINLQRGGHYTRTTPVPTTTTLPQPDVPPRDCGDILDMGFNKSGVYRIRPEQAESVFEVYCDQKFHGGGWTYIQKRRDGSVNFNRGWLDYTHGFGEVDGEFWLGNQKIHDLTSQDTYTLQVVLLDQENQKAFAEYTGFRVHGPNDYYSLRFGRFVGGTAGDGLRGTVDNGSRNLYLARFSTTDADHDSCTPCIYEGEEVNNCAQLHNGGWWYRACTSTNLNGRYIKDIQQECGRRCFGIEWETWHSEPRYSLKASIMMIKRDSQHSSPPQHN